MRVSRRWLRTWTVALYLVLALLGLAKPLSAEVAADRSPAGSVSQEQLDRWLKQYPDADANGDGKLTRAEAEAYRRQIAQRRSPQPSAKRDYKVEFTFATMSDGVKIALAVAYPRGFDSEDVARKWPAVLQMCGYPSVVEPTSPSRYGHQCVMINASLRGTGASAGAFSAVSRQNGLDGHDVIENWIVKQSWSNGKVAVDGHSWPGLTGFLIAATNPPHLKATVVSGLFDDVYRSIARIGGIRNSGFPVNWMNNLYRPTGVFGSDEAAIRVRGLSDGDYRSIVASRPERDVVNELPWKSLALFEDGPDWQNASPGTFADGVRAPIYVMHAYQDEQTGPSGAWLWAQVPDDVPKRLVLTNGGHGMTGHFFHERRAWIDYWLLRDGEEDDSSMTDLDQRVHVYFETLGKRGGNRVNEPLISSNFPLPETVWRRYYLRGGESLSPSSPDERAAGDRYGVAVGAPDEGIDGVHYLLSFDEPTAICGPITVTLWATCSVIDTDFFVVVADVDAQGYAQYLQRGLLRASHRALDEQASRWVTADGERTLIRPLHPHRNPQPLVPNKPHRFDIEVFPVGHVFRTGHRLAVRISQPPLVDPVAFAPNGDPSYTYESAQPAGQVTILRDAEHPSSLLLPVLPTQPAIAPQTPQPGTMAGIRGIKVE